MFLSDFQIDQILKSANSAWKHNKLPEKYKQEFMTTLKTYISQSGTIDNVCNLCLGSGKRCS